MGSRSMTLDEFERCLQHAQETLPGRAVAMAAAKSRNLLGQISPSHWPVDKHPKFLQHGSNIVPRRNIRVTSAQMTGKFQISAQISQMLTTLGQVVQIRPELGRTWPGLGRCSVVDIGNHSKIAQGIIYK